MTNSSLFLSSERVYLKPISLDNATEEYVDWLNDPEVTKGLLATGSKATLESVKHYISDRLVDANTLMLAIYDKDSDKHIGNIKVDNFEPRAGTCELGIMLGDKAFWGKGIGKEVIFLVLNHVFNQMGMRKVLLAVYANNPGAIKLYSNLGFEEEGVFKEHVRVGEDLVDKHYMSLFKKNFTSLQ